MNRSIVGLSRRRLIVAVLLIVGPFAEAAPTLLVSNGILTGANNVSVNGSLFDVTFEDGTCAALFSGCDDVSDFQFKDLASAQAAAQALLDAVFIDGAFGQFDSQPTLTRGCSDPEVCAAVIPWIPSVPNNTSGKSYFTGAAAANFVDPSKDEVGAEYALTTFDTSGPDGDILVFAVFSPVAPATVPEPPLFALMVAAVLAAGLVTHRGGRRSRRSLDLTGVARPVGCVDGSHQVSMVASRDVSIGA